LGLILALCTALSAAALGPARVQAACSVLLPGAGHFLAGLPGGRPFAATAKVCIFAGHLFQGSPAFSFFDGLSFAPNLPVERRKSF
jgi:hypothetical protein